MASGGPLQVAALGDSMTDEYAFGGPQGPSPSLVFGFLPPAQTYLSGRTSARNWPLILNALRGDQVSFGAYTTDNRGTPRDQGFAQDWALAGAFVGADPGNPADLTLAQQLGGTATSPGLLTQTAATTGTSLADIDAVVLMIGTNNYLGGVLDYLQSGGSQDIFTPPAGSALAPVNATIETGIGQAVGAIQAESPGTKIVVVTTPDLTQMPFVQADLASEPALAASLVPKIRAADAALTGDLTRFAQKFGLGLVDVNQLIQGLRQDPQIGDLPVDISAAGPAPGDAWTGDGIHLGTPVQGRLAQAIVRSIDQLEGGNVIAPLTDAELAAFARATTPAVAVAALTGADSTATTLDATVAAAPGATAVPTGMVTFATYVAATSTMPAYLGATLGQVALSAAGTASLTVPASALGGLPIVAVYNGDETFTQQTSAPQFAQVFATPTPTPIPIVTTIPTATPDPSNPTSTLVPTAPQPVPVEPTAAVTLSPAYASTKKGQTVTLTIAVQGVGVVPDPSPGGTVTLLVGGRRLQFEAVVGGRAAATFPLAKLRGRVVSANYSGDGILPTATAPPLRIAKNPPAPRSPIHQANLPAKSTAHAAAKPTAHAAAKPTAHAAAKPTAHAAAKPPVHAAAKPPVHAAAKPTGHHR